MVISLLSIVTNFVMNYLLVGALAERGLALSTSVVALLNFGLLYFLMQRRVEGLEGRATAAAVAKIVLASAIMAAACWGATRGLSYGLGEGFAARLINVSVSVATGAAVFYLAAWLLGVAELKAATNAVARRFVKRAR
jgi:putative peptidoglycan lipid II flippase